LTDAGQALASELQLAKREPAEAKPPEPEEPTLSDDPVLNEANRLADELVLKSTAGGRGDEFEALVGRAFAFLGFDIQVMGGSGNPDVVVDAALGQAAYRVLVEAKSRSGGHVQQNDVNFDALQAQKNSSSADYVLVVGPEFGGGHLEMWSRDKDVRLVRVEELKQIMLTHAVCPIPLDGFIPFLRGGGSTDDGVLTALLAQSENTSQLMQVARETYHAVCKNQESEASIDVNALYWILGGAYTVEMIQAAVVFLSADLIGALGQNEDGGFFTRLAPSALSLHLERLKQALTA
jgi:hypothetical protein